VTYKLGVSALFGQYILEPTSRTLITAAGRFDWLNLEATRSSVTTDSSSSAFSPKLSLTQRIFESSTPEGPRVNLYGAYSHAFVPPSRPSALQPEDAELDLQPENINNYEAGLKASVLDGKVGLEATYFFMTEEGVVLDTREGALFRPTNAGEQRYRGLETGVNFAASPRLSVFANASFYHNRFGDFVIEGEDPADDEVLEGNRLPFSPDYIANFGASFTPLASIDASVQVKLVGDVNSDRGNTFLVDAYSLLDAAVTYRRGRVRITVSGHNLLNEEYYWSGSTTSAESLDPGRPRQVLVTTSVRFR
jgi:outer membrane receptor protein involved in Fe transport